MTEQRAVPWELGLIHRMLKREFRALPLLVHTIPTGDLRRGTVVAAHIDLLVQVLRRHRDGQDEFLWPLLRHRLGADTDVLVRMTARNTRLAHSLSRLTSLLISWLDTPDPGTGHRLLGESLRVSATVDEHLYEEETDIFPLIHTHLTRGEWQAVLDNAKAYLRAHPHAFVILGMYLCDATPTEQEEFLASVPADFRAGWAAMGQEEYRRSRALLYPV
ncbi:hemerythrin domain-containing protein [Crossiella cryophila]|uniref:Hemerythrin-like domain-containing protein n=1 Tax=Crossiella cryophila TaxID=43355 RepID=A0A7W7FVR3_9PSEU|nr:hemerythrin domain-containing protein [Crossiella cryophila]MBB4678758.1 hypothetical protein [Crossiella cryophila]